MTYQYKTVNSFAECLKLEDAGWVLINNGIVTGEYLMQYSEKEYKFGVRMFTGEFAMQMLGI